MTLIQTFKINDIFLTINFTEILILNMVYLPI